MDNGSLALDGGLFRYKALFPVHGPSHLLIADKMIESLQD